MNNRGNRRIGAKQQDVNRSAKILIITSVVWILYIIDEILVAHNPIWLIVIFTLGIWSVGIVIAKPGKFAKKVQRVGFWNALFNRTPRNRRGRGRGGRNYRR